MRTKLALLAFILSSILLTIWNAPIGAQSGVPTPESVLGYTVGADLKLATYDETIAYFQRLDAASDRLMMIPAGQSSQGRTTWMAAISAPANLARLDRYREIARRLAHPDGLGEVEARALAREGKTIVHIDGGLHASEVAGPQHTMQLAYDLVARGDDPAIAPILENVILLLWPTINPDGQQMVAEWYRGNVGTPYEISPLPRLYQEYVGHDNNRDGYMLNMIESRVMEHAWRTWEPQIIHVHHQTSPFPTRIWLPPFAEPIASRAPALISREINSIGMAMAQGLDERGQVGATHMGTGYDAWYPGYIDYKPVFQNIASYWTETALYAYATPKLYTIEDFPSNMRDLRPQALYASPWPGGWWRLRDAVEYMHTASMSMLDYAARYRETILLNRYRSGRAQIEKYRHAPPYAYIIPPDQRDPVAAVELLRRVAFQGVRVAQLSAPVIERGISYPAGSWVIPMDQEYAEVVREIFEVQHYPDLRESPNGPLEQPYDAAGWTLPLQMGVAVTALDAPMSADLRGKLVMLGEAPPPVVRPAPYDTGVTDAAPFDSAPGIGFNADPVAAAIVPSPGVVTGSGGALVLDPAQTNTFKALNQAWTAGARVSWDGVATRRDDGARAAGYVVTGLTPAQQGEIASRYALRAERTAAVGAGRQEVRRLRVGLYRPWMASMDEGWTRWVLERYGFPIVSLSPDEVRHGRLADRIDVLVIADEGRGLLNGYAEGTLPAQYTGGIGSDGVRAIDDFVRGGGRLVCFNRSSGFAIQQFGLPVKDVLSGLKRQEYFTGGSLLSVEVTAGHPIMAGMPDRAAVFVEDSPAFETQEGFAGDVLARYQANGSPLLSGYLLGEQHLRGHAAALDVRHGQGHIVLLGFRPQWRGQSFGTFRIIFNAVTAPLGTVSRPTGEVATAGAKPAPPAAR